MTETGGSKWPPREAQQEICRRGDILQCIVAGAAGCELCTPCRYADTELAAQGLPVDELRASHTWRIQANPGSHVCPPSAIKEQESAAEKE